MDLTDTAVPIIGHPVPVIGKVEVTEVHHTAHRVARLLSDVDQDLAPIHGHVVLEEISISVHQVLNEVDMAHHQWKSSVLREDITKAADLIKVVLSIVWEVTELECVVFHTLCLEKKLCSSLLHSLLSMSTYASIVVADPQARLMSSLLLTTKLRRQ